MAGDYDNNYELIYCIDEKSDYRVCFDLPTPRPHFVLFRRNVFYGITLDHYMNNKLILKNLVQFTYDLKSREEFQNTHVVLSVHTGRWRSKDQFHCHLCINIESYLKIFKQRCKSLDLFKPTKHWTDTCNGNLKEAYIKLVENSADFERRNYIRHKNIDLARIDVNCEQLTYTLNDQNVKIIFHKSQPRIGFYVEPIEDDFEKYFQVYKCMVDFANKLKYFVPPKGAHLCLNLRKSQDDDFNVHGYILLAADEYYKLLPIDERNVWVEAFKSNESFYQSS